MHRPAPRPSPALVPALLFASALVASAPWLLGPDRIHALAAALATPHPPGSCALCGGTTAFVALWRGDIAAAHAANALALPLWLACALAPALAAVAFRRGVFHRRP
jgi:hypothetical protein